MFSFNKPKIIVDENVPLKIIRQLRLKGFNVKRAPIGESDKNISKIAKLESRIILTFDKHFIDKLLFPPEKYAGIILLDIHPPTIDKIMVPLFKLFKEIKTNEFKGRLFILSSFGFRMRR